MDFIVPEWIVNAGTVTLFAFFALVILGFVARFILPFVKQVIDQQEELLDRQIDHADKERLMSEAAISQWKTIAATLERTAQAAVDAYETKLQAVKLEQEQKLKHMMEDRDRERDELRGRVAAAEKGIKERDEAIARMEREITILQEQNTTAEKKIAESERKILELQEFNEQKDARIAELKMQLDKTVRERDDFASELERLKTRLVELEKVQESHSSEVET